MPRIVVPGPFENPISGLKYITGAQAQAFLEFAKLDPDAEAVRRCIRDNGKSADGSVKTPERIAKGLRWEAINCGMHSHRADFTDKPRGDSYDFPLPGVPIRHKMETLVETKGCSDGIELLINDFKIGEADAYTLITGDMDVGFELLGWATMPDVREFTKWYIQYRNNGQPVRRQGNNTKYIFCTNEQPQWKMRNPEELWCHMASEKPIENRYFDDSKHKPSWGEVA